MSIIVLADFVTAENLFEAVPAATDEPKKLRAGRQKIGLREGVGYRLS